MEFFLLVLADKNEPLIVVIELKRPVFFLAETEHPALVLRRERCRSRRGRKGTRLRRKRRRRLDRPWLSKRGSGAQKQCNNKKIDTFHGSSFSSQRRN